MKTIIFILLLFVFSHSNCQIIVTGRILDKETKKPLVYANIMVENRAIGASSDENGEFNIQLNDTINKMKLVFSFVGYKTKQIPINSFIKNNTVFLEENLILLNEINLNENKNLKKEIILNEFKKRKCNLLYSTKPFKKETSLWIPYRENEPTIEGIFFPSNTVIKNLYLKELLVFLRSFAVESICRIHIFNVNKKGIPQTSLINIPIIKVKEGDIKIKINLEKYSLMMPKNGVFIGIELIVSEKNRTTIVNKENEKIELISPFLYYVPTKIEKNNYTFLRYTKGKWKNITKYQPRYNNETKKFKKIYKPAISIVLN